MNTPEVPNMQYVTPLTEAGGMTMAQQKQAKTEMDAEAVAVTSLAAVVEVVERV